MVACPTLVALAKTQGTRGAVPKRAAPRASRGRVQSANPAPASSAWPEHRGNCCGSVPIWGILRDPIVVNELVEPVPLRDLLKSLRHRHAETDPRVPLCRLVGPVGLDD